MVHSIPLLVVFTLTMCLLYIPHSFALTRYTRLVTRCATVNTNGYKDLEAPLKYVKAHRAQESYLYDEYLKDCDKDIVCVCDLAAASEHNNDEFVRHYLQPGTVFMLPVADSVPYTWLVKDIINIFHKYNASSLDYQLVHVADESYHYNHPKLLEFYLTWKKVYRQTWHITPEYKRMVADNRLGWIPITPPHPKPNTSGILPASMRKFRITFRGNRATNIKRNSHWKGEAASG